MDLLEDLLETKVASGCLWFVLLALAAILVLI